MVDNGGDAKAAIKKVEAIGKGIRDLSKLPQLGGWCRVERCHAGKNVRTKYCLGGECFVVYKNVMFNEPNNSSKPNTKLSTDYQLA